MSYDRVVCFDLELCCWEDRRPLGEIIEIGIAEVNLTSGVITRTSQYYITPVHDEVSEYCTVLTGIAPSKLLKQGQPFHTAIQSMTDKYGSNHTVYVAWGKDHIMLEQQCAQYNIACPVKNVIDLSVVYLLQQRCTSKNRVGLQTALKHFDLVFEGKPHSGLDDAINTAKLAHLLL